MNSKNIFGSRVSLLHTALACVAAGAFASARAEITTVFYILLENRCFTSGADKSYTNVLYHNINGGSPYLTALCTPGNTDYTATYNGQVIPQTAQSSWCSAYHHVFATYNNTNVSPYGANSPAGQSVHPSEPNYVFMEAGSNLSILNDNDPYGSGGSVPAIATFLTAHPTFTGENLSALLQNKGISWKSYTEGTGLLSTANTDFNLVRTSNGLTNNISPIGTRTVPYSSFSGTSPSYTNQYNGTHQYNFATKHTGQLFFPATNGGTTTAGDSTPSNPMAGKYASFEEFDQDLANGTVAQYSVLTPDQYNDGHTALATAFTYHNYGGTGSGVDQTFAANSDIERVAQMDSFCSIMVPKIMSSSVYQAGKAAIVIWTDETEGSPQNDFYHTLTEIVISPQAKGNAYNSTLNLTHSSDVATMQKIFGVVADTDSGYLNDAANFSNKTPHAATVPVIINNGQGLQVADGKPFLGFGTGTAQDMNDLFKPGTIPNTLPTFDIVPGGYSFNRKNNTDTQTVTVTSKLTATSGPVYLLVGNLANSTLTNATGVTANHLAGTPYVKVADSLAPGASAMVTLTFTAPTGGNITDSLSVVTSSTAP